MKLLLALLLPVSLLTIPGTADPTPAVDSTYQFDNANSNMTIYGSSNVRDWTMDVTQVNGAVELEGTDETLPSIQRVRAEMPIQQIVSEKDRLQRHAHEALKKEEHPMISFVSSDIQVAKAQADSFSVVANGNLTIAGETHAVTLTAKGAHNVDGTLTINGDHELLLSTYDVERPSLMFGAIKVDDPVRIGFNLVLSPSSPASAAK